MQPIELFIYLLNSVPISLKIVVTMEVSTAAKKPLKERLYISKVSHITQKGKQQLD